MYLGNSISKLQIQVSTHVFDVAYIYGFVGWGVCT